MSRGLPEVVFVLGGPGSGKGTQCARAVKHLGFEHLSAGDLLREERQRPGSQYAAMIEQKIRDGQIVPVEVTCALIVAAMRRATGTRFLVDGFPRNADNLAGWQRACSETTRLLFVLFFECSREECSRRCLARGAAGSGRSDDNEESLLKRFDTYVKDTLPVVSHYEQLGQVRRIDANHDPDTVFEKVKAAFAEAGINGEA